MSTKCEIRITDKSINWNSNITLYHHWDGYPEYIIPMIYKAYCYNEYGVLALSETDLERFKSEPGKVASLLCWAEPMAFEPVSSDDLPMIVDYSYQIFCNFSKSDEMTIWEIEIYQTDEDDCGEFRLIQESTPLEELIELYR